MVPIVDGALKVIGEVIEAYNIHEAREPFERVRKLRLEILNEKAMGDNADQVKISHLKRQLDIEGETLNSMVSAGLKVSK